MVRVFDVRRSIRPESGYRISTYLAALMLLGAIALLPGDPTSGALYALAGIAVIAPLRLRWLRPEQAFLPLLLAIVVWGAYLIRPLILTAFPWLFMYFRLGSITTDDIRLGIALTAGFALMVLTGTVLGQLMGRSREDRWAKVPPPGREDLLMRIRPLANILLVGTLVGKAILTVKYQVGVRGAQATTSYGFLLRVLPDTLVYPILVLYLVRYRMLLKRVPRLGYALLLVLFSAVTLLEGSRAFVYQIALALLIYFLANKGDIRLKAGKTVATGLVGVVLLMGSFLVGTAARRLIVRRVDPAEALATLVGSVTSASESRAYLGQSLSFTQRLLGFDGLIASEIYHPPYVVREFRPSVMASRVVTRLTPLQPPRNQMSTGKAVSVYFFQLPYEKQHAGGLGLAGTFRLMFGPKLALAGFFILGLLAGGGGKVVRGLKNYDVRFLAEYILAYHLSWLIMTGNLDLLGSGFITSSVQLAALVVLVGVMRKSVSHSRETWMILPGA